MYVCYKDMYVRMYVCMYASCELTNKKRAQLKPFPSPVSSFRPCSGCTARFLSNRSGVFLLSFAVSQSPLSPSLRPACTYICMYVACIGLNTLTILFTLHVLYACMYVPEVNQISTIGLSPLPIKATLFHNST